MESTLRRMRRRLRIRLLLPPGLLLRISPTCGTRSSVSPRRRLGRSPDVLVRRSTISCDVGQRRIPVFAPSDVTHVFMRLLRSFPRNPRLSWTSPSRPCRLLAHPLMPSLTPPPISTNLCILSPRFFPKSVGLLFVRMRSAPSTLMSLLRFMMLLEVSLTFSAGLSLPSVPVWFATPIPPFSRF